MITRPPRLFRSHRSQICAGVVLVAAGYWLLWDAWDGSGRPHPRWLGWALPW